jgi:hypothetical protein
MRKRWSVAVLLLLCAVTLLAKSVSETEAQQLAKTFLQGRGKKADGLRMKQLKKVRRTSATADGAVGYYVFNLGEADGFVVVSGDDRTAPILGYADQGCIDADNMPDGLRYLLDGYEQQLQLLDADTQLVGEGRSLRRTPLAAIAPLITTTWYQSEPYNNLCPEIGGTRAVTGCVATSMAQVMNYYQWPETACTDIPGYTTSTQDKDKKTISLTVDGLGATTFDWGNMIPDYTSVTGTAAQQQAVATLMQYCGVAVQMAYGLGSNNGSSAYNEAIPFALKTYFGYDGGIHHVYRKNYSYAAWVNMIYSELEARRPVILGGQSMGGGHSFVCDGYDSQPAGKSIAADYFHINWGWSGRSDGYFLLSLLNPYDQGIGGSSTLDGFSYSQDAILGIQEPGSTVSQYCMSLEGLNLGGDDANKTSKTFTRVDNTKDFTGIDISFIAYNYYYGDNAFDVELQLQDAGGSVVERLKTVLNETRTWNQTIGDTYSVTIPSGVAKGTYYIKVMSKLHSDGSWQECYDGNAYRLTAVISDNQLIITVPIPANTQPSATLAVSGDGDRLTGQEYTVTATITGGANPYNGNVFLRVNDTAVLGSIINVAASEEQTLEFSFIPQKVGTNTIALYNSRTGGQQIGSSTSVNVIASLNNNGSNRPIVEANEGVTTNVVLTGRTLYKDGDWNTLCLPFNVTIEDSPLAGAEARTLSSSAYADGVLTLNFTDPVSTLSAGVPYIIKWTRADGYVDDDSHNIVSPTFTGVTIVKGYNDVNTTWVDFHGTYNYLSADEENRGILLVGAGNTLYWPKTGASLGAQRACFRLNGLEAADVNGARMSFDDTDATGIGDNYHKMTTDDSWCDLQGRKMVYGQQPTVKGLYIQNGRKVVVK